MKNQEELEKLWKQIKANLIKQSKIKEEKSVVSQCLVYWNIVQKKVKMIPVQDRSANTLDQLI